MSKLGAIFGLSTALVLGVAGDAFAREQAPSLGQWRDYALRGITPEFDWADRPQRAEVTPTVLSVSLRPREALTRALKFEALDAQQVFGLAVSQSSVAESPAFGQGDIGAQTLTDFGSGIERTLVAPSITQRFETGTQVTAAVVLAYQQFASWGLGSTAVEASSPSALPVAFTESSMGTGLRLQVEQPLMDNVSFVATAQSRVDMDAFQSYRGVYSDPGDFDIPGFVSAGINWNAGAVGLGVGVSRVLYSEMSPFASASLPTRVLSLLGDGTSPEFIWRDLTVVNVDLSWQATARDAFMLRYATRQQPEPTSSLLSRALEDLYTDNNLGLAYVRQLGEGSNLRLAASYAGAEYFLGNANYANRNGQGGDQVEVEAVLTVRF
jgi:hypothetical protein